MESKRLDNAALAAGISPSYITRTASRSLSRLSPNSACWMRCHRSTAATKVAVKPAAERGKFSLTAKKCRCRWQDAVSISGS
ncbi:4-alpha-glucanotransferase [Klebsiella pneumoniae]|uniref:4-alpha-glucanotransferase n=1 Tax=Klebsiella pneumoniae TaxID=573 RepID=A0A377VTX3_KLEPN|nr:4-alpha-glucanotransferase [Klebsiella pneumoniae]